MYHLPAITKPAFLKDPLLKRQYRGKRVLVLGGDGFMGTHVASALHLLGADVSILSRRGSSVLESLDVTIHRGHLMQEDVLRLALRNKDIVFDLAGSSGAIVSNRDPHLNFAAECEPHLTAFQMAAEMLNPPLMVFCSSRTVYGKPQKLPVNESHPLAPISAYAIHKLTLERYLQNFHNTRGLDYLIFRLSNPYGPYLWQEGKDYGIINQFLVKAFFGDPIRLFGDGAQLRDYIFIDDVVEAFIRTAARKKCRNQVFNLGGPAPVSMKDAVTTLLDQRPGSEVQSLAWPADFRAAETGDYVTSLRKLRKYVPELKQTRFAEGVRRTFAAYEKLLGNKPAKKAATGLPPVKINREAKLPRPCEWSGKRVLVTGANGFIGGRLMEKLLEMGAFVAGVNRSPLHPRLARNPRALSVQLDLAQDNAERYRELEEFKPDVIFHLASKPDGKEIENHAVNCADINLRGTINLLELARRCAVSAFVFGDSVKVFGNSPVPHRENSITDPNSSYAASKLAAWHYCRMFSRVHGLRVVALRPTMVYGPGQNGNLFGYLAKSLAEGRIDIALDGGTQTRDPLYIDDAVNAYLRAAELANRLSGRAIPIGGGTERTVKELASLFIRSTGCSAEVHCRQDAVRATEMMRSYCDNADAWEALRWLPAVPIEEGFRRTAEYLLGHRMPLPSVPKEIPVETVYPKQRATLTTEPPL